jgi:hypothetical protein
VRIDVYTQAGKRIESYFSIQPNWIIEHNPNGMRIRLGKKLGGLSFCTMDVIEIIGKNNNVIIREEGDIKRHEVNT